MHAISKDEQRIKPEKKAGNATEQVMYLEGFGGNEYRFPKRYLLIETFMVI
jgi:hypothetical protein